MLLRDILQTSIIDIQWGVFLIMSPPQPRFKEMNIQLP